MVRERAWDGVRVSENGSESGENESENETESKIESERQKETEVDRGMKDREEREKIDRDR